MPSRPVVMVTGASRGLGRAMAERLLTTGVDVIGTFRHSVDATADLHDLASTSGTRIEMIDLDLTQLDQLDEAPARVTELLHGSFAVDHLRALVNNAGAGVLEPFAQTTVEQFDWLMALNVRGPYFLTQGLLPLLTRGSSVVNLSTALTRGVVPGGSAYAAAKGAVEVLTRYLAVELAHRGIRVTTLMGGAARTDFGGGAMYLPAVEQASSEKIALGRMAEPSDIAAAIHAIISDDFHWSTGSIVDVSGGQSL